MFLPWSLITGRPTKQEASRRGHKPAKLQRSKVKVELLEDRVVPANYFVDATFAGASTGSLTQPFKNIQDALIAANNNPGSDNVFVYGNNSSDPSINSYVWTRDGDTNGDGFIDGNMDVGTDGSNPVNLFFRASLLNTATVDGSGGAAASLIVKMRDNIVDVRDNSQLRIEGANNTNRVIFTSIFDDSAGGDTNGDGLVNAPQRTNWGGIRFRAEAIDQGATSATGSFINFADLRYTGATIFDEIVGFPTEFGSIRMEANATNTFNVRSAQVRVWNTTFRSGGRALDININALGQGGKASSLITGPDLGAATAQPLTFVDNSINGAFIFVPSEPFSGFLQQMFVSSTLDDVGVPYVLTQRLSLGKHDTTPSAPSSVVLTFNEGTILKSQNTGLDGIDFGEPNDRVFGTIRVNGTVNRPVLFTSLTDDTLVPGTDLPALYNNGSADTNNDGDTTTPTPGDWGGIRIAQGNIDHAVVRYGGGFTQVNGTFVSWPAIRVFARDLRPAGGVVQQVRVANTEVTQTYSSTSVVDPSTSADSPGIDLFSRDDGDTRFAGPFSPIVRTGDVQIMDNYIHDNQGKAIQAHPLYYHDARNSTGGYGVFFRRNILEDNQVNGVFVKFILDQSRGIDQNLPSVGGVWDDTDIVTVIEGQALIVRPDQYFAMMSRRTVTPDAASGGYLQRFNNATAFLNGLVLRMPGNLPTNTTQPLNLPLQRGPLSVNPGLVDSDLFYYLTNFDATARNLATSNGTLIRGEEWRDWGVNFVYGGSSSNINDPLRPFVTVSDPSNPGGFMLKTDTLDGNGSYEMVFPNAVSAVGFWIVNNQSNSPTQRIELIGANGQVIETAAMPTTTANGRTFFGRISKTPIYKVRIIDDAGDAISSQSTFGVTNQNVAIPNNNTNAELAVNVPSSFNISDVRVNLTITHGQASDLILELVAPNGTVVPLATRTGGTGAGANYTNTNFGNSFTTPITAGLAPFSGNFYPVSFDPFSATPTGLAVLNGLNAQGTWKLRVRDANTNGSTPITGAINNFTLTFKGTGLTLNNPGITGLTWVEAGESLVVKANTEYTTVTAGSIANGFQGITQDGNGVITDGFMPQMTPLANGTNATGQFTFGQNTTTVFDMTTPTPLNNAAGDTVIQLPISSDFVASDLTVRLNLAYSGPNSDLRIRLRGPDGSEIELVGAGQSNGNNGFTNTTFDDQAQVGLRTINVQTGAQFTAPYNSVTLGTPFQSWSFTNTVATAPTTNTPFGLGFYRGKNIRGIWSIVVSKTTSNSGTLNDFRLSFRAPVSGWGSTLRILGQGNNPVVMTGINDDTIGAGPVGKVQRDTGSDGPSTANPGQWQGLQILAGVNTSLSEVVTQNPNGTLNRRYADLNPYTRFDEGLTYPGLSNPTGTLLSTQDALFHSLAGTSGGTTVATRAPFDSIGAANLQDGTLVEFADIRFATTGIDQRGYPKTKLAIDGNEYESAANPNGSVPNGADLMQPLPELRVNQLNQVRFATLDGTYTVAGRLGGSGDGPATDDVDWYELPSNTPDGSPLAMYIDIERGRRTAGNDEPNGRGISVAVFNHEFQLLWWSGPGGGGYSDTTQLSGNTLGPVVLQNGDIPYTTGTGFTRDAKFIAVMPADRLPRSFVPTTASPAGLQPDMTTYNFAPLQADRVSTTGQRASADGGSLTLLDSSGNVSTITGDSIWDPPGPSGTTIGGYEMQLRFSGFERHLNPPKSVDGQILIRSNTISNASGDGIRLQDLRMNTTNTNLGATMPLQAARYPATATNLAVNSNGNPFRNEDVNNVNPAFSAPANFVPGVTVHNNLIVGNRGNGIVLFEDRNTNAISPGNGLTPTAFTQISNNTIDNNLSAGIGMVTRGGPNVMNNIVSNNGFGIAIVDGYDISGVTPPVVPSVSYNIFHNNTNFGDPFTGAQNLIGNGALNNPLYVDPSSFDYRIQLASPAVDSAVSDLQDRLRSARFPQVPTRAPNLDLRGRSRVDNPSRPNVGSGAFPFYDRGALEANELSLRVIGLSVLSDNNIIGAPINTLSIVFTGRVDLATFTSSTVFLRNGLTTGAIIPLNFNLMTSLYDKNSDTHTFNIPLFSQLNDGTYYLILNGSATTTSVKDVAGQLLDGEFPAPYNLPSGDGAAGGTFIYPFSIRTSTISGNVWRNDNGNTTIDAGEPGLGSVGVRLNGPGADGILFTGDDVILATATTSAAGAYSFNNLASGSYYVTVNTATLPNSSYRLNTPPAAKVVNLPIGGIRSNLNFGYWIDNGNGVVSGRLFDDLNGNGVFDAGEPGIIDNNAMPVAPVSFLVTLTSGGADLDLSTAADNVVYTTFSDLDGSYAFTGTAGNPIYGNNYRIDVDETPLPTGYVRTSPLITPITFSILPGGSRVQNYGYQLKQATINGTVFNDADGNGALNGGETGIAGVTVRLLGAGIDGLFGTADDLATLITTTAASGAYTFTPLTAGNYRVVVDSTSAVLTNFFLTTNNTTQNLFVPSGSMSTVVTAANVGYRQDPFLGQILGKVFNDLDSGGDYDIGEPGFAGVNVRLRWAGRDGIVGNSDDQVFNVTTAADGSYNAINLPVGDFYVEPTTGLPAGLGLTTPASLPLKITLGYAGVNNSLGFFGYQVANSSISGFVFNDLNGNGSAQVSETGRFSSVRVYVDQNLNGIYDTGEYSAFSAAGTGIYTITNLPAGIYSVRIDTATLPPSVPAGFVDSTGAQGVVVGSSVNINGINFGLQQRNAQVTGRVFLDLNNNGIQDPSEVGSPGQTITLTFTSSPIPNNFTNPQVTTTLSDGSFAFTGLPAGSYTLNTTVPTGGTIATPPGNNQLISLSAGASSSNLFPVQFAGSATAGVWYMTFAGPSTTLFNSDGSFLQVADTDIVRLTAPSAGTWRYDVFFRGANFGLTQGGTEAIDAFTFTNTGEVIISTKGTYSINQTYIGGFGSGNNLNGFGEDLLKFTPSAPNAGNGLENGTWSLFFKGSRVGLSGSSENVDAVSLIYSGSTLSRILLSTTGTALVSGGVSANPQDVLSFKPTTTGTLGANTAGSFTKYFTGSTRGLSNPTQHNLDALFFLPNASAPTKPSLFISTAGNFSVPAGLTGNSGDILRFNATSGGPLGPLAGTTFNSVALRGSDFGHATANVTGFYMGVINTDPNPFGGGVVTPSSMGASLASMLVNDSSGTATASRSAAPATSTSSAAKVAQAVATSSNSSKTTTQQADQFFTSAKRQASSSVTGLVKNLLARLR